MARPKKPTTAKQFATLYVNGPVGVKGNWEKCEDALGVKIELNQEIREAIISEGGFIDNVMPVVKPDLTNVEEFNLDLSKFDYSSAKTDDDWKRVAKDLDSTIKGIADGSIKANAAQVAVVKYIMDRAYGKLSAKEDSVAMPSGVIILPALGERSEQFVCPNCKLSVEKKFPKKDARPDE